jgi:hypothetical protein
MVRLDSRQGCAYWTKPIETELHGACDFSRVVTKQSREKRVVDQFGSSLVTDEKVGWCSRTLMSAAQRPCEGRSPHPGYPEAVIRRVLSMFVIPDALQEGHANHDYSSIDIKYWTLQTRPTKPEGQCGVSMGTFQPALIPEHVSWLARVNVPQFRNCTRNIPA